MVDSFSITDITCITPETVIEDCTVTVNKNKISGINGARTPHDYLISGKGYLYPALINVHDHFLGNYVPRVGPQNRNFYLNWAPWDADLKSSKVYKERANIKIDDSYLLSGYKNLFSGVVTANDHFPHEINDPFISKSPIRMIREYTLAHECSSYDLRWGDGIEVEHARAVENNYPFITHLEEGFDEESQSGINILEKLNCLDDYDVFIHCIGFSDEDIAKVKKAGAHVAWCPASNIFMFNLTCKIKKMIEAGLNISIGTDSTHTGSINILEEIRFARDIYKKMYNCELDPTLLVKMATLNPAKAIRMDKYIGSIEPGKLADLLLISPKYRDPYLALVNLQLEDIELLTKDGRPIYGNEIYEDFFIECGVDYSKIVLKNKRMIVVGDPAGLLCRIHEAVGFKKELDFMPLYV
jgi:5-methylthioadenosine/S-adenosylhomocysteine deaminase